jgi:hypothetical protein
MASVVTPLDQPSNYKDSQARVDRQKQHDMLQKSNTLYVGFTHELAKPIAPDTLVPVLSRRLEI